MKKVQFFQVRPAGNTSHKNFCLGRKDAVELLLSVIFLPDAHEGKAEIEDFDGEAKIINTSSFGNGVLVSALVNDWVAKALLNVSQIKTLEIDGEKYWREHQNQKFRKENVNQFH